MDYDVVIVGGGIAGLTAAAFISKAGLKILICEKDKKVGGLVNSFDFKGFTFDGGIRAIENSGIVLPMLRQLGLNIEFVKNNVSIGIENEVVNLVSKDSLQDYQRLLNNQFPESVQDIEKINDEIKQIMKYMDVLYGIDNPIFMDLQHDREYLFHTLLPWMFQFLPTIRKIDQLNTPVLEYLTKITKNQALLDIIAQHFFKNTPTFFALSYFSLYLDYQYPLGGTGRLVDQMKQFILDHQGEILTETEICSLNPTTRQVIDTKGQTYHYQKLIWAADLKKLYAITDLNAIVDQKIKKRVVSRKNDLADLAGNDSIVTLYLTLDIDKQYFANIANAHFFYTPYKTGLSSVDGALLQPNVSADGKEKYTADRSAIVKWLRQYYDNTTYEISCPVIRDESLAPEGKTGLIISTLFDYPLAKHIADMGWYDEFKTISADFIIDVLSRTIYKGLRDKVIDQFTSTPLTIAAYTGNTDGAITGWAFTSNKPPVVNSMPKVAQSINTPIPDVFQAGQWSYSPSGLPISILTGKLAANKMIKLLK